MKPMDRIEMSEITYENVSTYMFSKGTEFSLINCFFFQSTIGIILTVINITFVASIFNLKGGKDGDQNNYNFNAVNG